MNYNATGKEPTGYYYWDGGQWVPISSGGVDINSNLVLNGTTLELTHPGEPLTTDLSSLDDNTDNDSVIGNEAINSVILNASNECVIDEARTVFTQDLSSLIDDADADPTNGYNTGVNLNGTVLEVNDNERTVSQDLSSLTDSIYWDRDASNGYLCLSTLEDRVGIGMNKLSAKVHLKGGGVQSDHRHQGYDHHKGLRQFCKRWRYGQ